MTATPNPSGDPVRKALADEAKRLAREHAYLERTVCNGAEAMRSHLIRDELYAVIDELAALSPSAPEAATRQAARLAVNAFDEFRNTEPAKVVTAINALRDSLAVPATSTLAEGREAELMKNLQAWIVCYACNRAAAPELSTLMSWAVALAPITGCPAPEGWGIAPASSGGSAA